MNIVVFGATGQIGFELMRSLRPLGRVRAAPRDMVDLCRPAEIEAWIDYARPDVIVNAAAMTSVDRIEHQAAMAGLVNAEAVGVMAASCLRHGALLVQFSTDYVFDGEADAAYPEDAPTAPLNVYGRTKLQAETLIRASGCRHLILRVGGIYSWRRANFLLSILAAARATGEIRAIADHYAAPTPAWLVADTAALMLSRAQEGGRQTGLRTTVHLTCAGRTSWHGFATAIIDGLVAEPSPHERARLEAAPQIVPIRAAEFAGDARRPRQALLALDRLNQDWGLFMPSWEGALELTLRHS